MIVNLDKSLAQMANLQVVAKYIESQEAIAFVVSSISEKHAVMPNLIEHHITQGTAYKLIKPSLLKSNTSTYPHSTAEQARASLIQYINQVAATIESVLKGNLKSFAARYGHTEIEVIGQLSDQQASALMNQTIGQLADLTYVVFTASALPVVNRIFIPGYWAVDASEITRTPCNTASPLRRISGNTAYFFGDPDDSVIPVYDANVDTKTVEMEAEYSNFGDTLAGSAFLSLLCDGEGGANRDDDGDPNGMVDGSCRAGVFAPETDSFKVGLSMSSTIVQKPSMITGASWPEDNLCLAPKGASYTSEKSFHKSLLGNPAKPHYLQYKAASDRKGKKGKEIFLRYGYEAPFKGIPFTITAAISLNLVHFVPNVVLTRMASFGNYTPNHGPDAYADILTPFIAAAWKEVTQGSGNYEATTYVKPFVTVNETQDDDSIPLVDFANQAKKTAGSYQILSEIEISVSSHEALWGAMSMQYSVPSTSRITVPDSVSAKTFTGAFGGEKGDVKRSLYTRKAVTNWHSAEDSSSLEFSTELPIVSPFVPYGKSKSYVDPNMVDMTTAVSSKISINHELYEDNLPTVYTLAHLSYGNSPVDKVKLTKSWPILGVANPSGLHLRRADSVTNEAGKTKITLPFSAEVV